MSATLITVAPTGDLVAKADAPGLPVTVAELVDTARDCQAIGAAAIHPHVRDAAGEPTLDPPALSDAVTALRGTTDLVIQLALGGPGFVPERDRLAALDCEPDMACLPMGSVNVGDDVFVNRWEFIAEAHQRMREREIVPVYTVFDLGQVAALRRLLDSDGPPFGGHVHCELVMGTTGGMPGTASALVDALRALPPDATASATGIGSATLPVALAALSAGAHIRVGMEDTLTYSRGLPVRDNQHVVSRAVGLAKIAQRGPMPASDARAMLGVAERREPGRRVRDATVTDITALSRRRGTDAS